MLSGGRGTSFRLHLSGMILISRDCKFKDSVLSHLSESHRSGHNGSLSRRKPFIVKNISGLVLIRKVQDA